MQANSRPIVHLVVTIDHIEYLLGTLRFQKDLEFSYFFRDPRQPIANILDCNTGMPTLSLEHITWHSTEAHIRLQISKDSSGKNKKSEPIGQFAYPGGILLSDQRRPIPLYIESLFFDATPPLLKYSDFQAWTGSFTQTILDLNSSQGFTIVLMLVPSDCPTPWILNQPAFGGDIASHVRTPRIAHILDEIHGPGRIQLTEKWDMLLITSPHLTRITFVVPEQLKTGFRLLNYQGVLVALGDLISHASGL